jgi:hypothetical protein
VREKRGIHKAGLNKTELKMKMIRTTNEETKKERESIE